MQTPQQVSDAGAAASGAGWWVVGLLMALAFLCHFNRISMSVAGAEQMMDQYRISEVEMGWIYSAYLLVYTVFMIPGGWLIDRVGAKAALATMALGSAILVFATGATGAFLAPIMVVPALVVVRSGLGLVSVPMHPGAARAAALWMPPGSRVLANSLVGAASLLGIASTYYVFGSLIDALGWPRAFMVSAFATFAAFCVWTFGTDRAPRALQVREDLRREPARQDLGAAHLAPPSDTPAWADWLAALTDRSVLLLTFSYAAVGYFQYLFFFWLQYYFDTVLKLGKDASRVNSTIPMLSMAVGMFAGGWIAGRASRRLGAFRARVWVATTGMAVGACLLLVGVLATDPVWVVTWFSCSMGLVGMSEGPFWATAVELGGRRGGLSAAIVNTGGNAGGMLAPVVTPWLSGYFGWRASVPVAGVVCLLGAALWYGIRPSDAESPATQLADA